MEQLAEFISDSLFGLANKSEARRMKKELETDAFFYGVRTIERRNMLKTALKRYPITTKEEFKYVVRRLFNGYSQEEHYCSIDIAEAYSEFHSPDMLSLYEEMLSLSHAADSVDPIASRLIGPLIYTHPELEEHVEHWIRSTNVWLNRTAIMLHFHRKKQTNIKLLVSTINQLFYHNDYVVQFAIGKVLREYSKFNGDWVMNYISDHPRLNNVSRREALRHLKKGQIIL